MWILAAAAAAASFGTGDFLGGVATRRVGSAQVVVAASQVVGLGLAVLLVPLFPHEVTQDAVFAGAAAGLAGAAGLVLLYRGLAVGDMGLVAPIAAVGSAVIPVAYGYVIGERPGPSAIVGSLAALAAVWLVTGGRRGLAGARRGEPGIVEALGAGLGFAAFFILLRETDVATGLVPLVAARTASLCALGVLLLALRPPHGRLRAARLPMAGSGTFDMVANALFLFAARAGLISIVVVVTSLYPVFTVAMARLVLREPISSRRRAGLGLAVTGIALIAISGA